jgi:lipoprotein signal peptidase
MSFKTRFASLLVGSGFFVCLDQWLKWQSLHTWTDTVPLAWWIGWHPFLNPGVAFGIPIPQVLVVLFTSIVLVAIVIRLWSLTRVVTQSSEEWLQTVGLTTIFFGATSNFIDRLAYNHTVDFFFIFTSVINIADGLIVLGFLVLFISLRRT